MLALISTSKIDPFSSQPQPTKRTTLDQPWTLVDGIELCRLLEAAISPKGYHCALAGSVLIKGQSNKDLDVIIYPHNTKIRNRTKASMIKHIASSIKGMVAVKKIDFAGYDKKYIYHMEYLGRRIDFFFVK